MSKDQKFVALALVTSLFFIWGFALNLNPILIAHLKKACQLTDFQSSLVDSASYIAYFLLPIPAARFMHRYGYKGGILLGLVLFAIGAFLFFPAAAVRSYAFFLSSLFVIFSGAAFLETAANPYITILGDPATATQRINFSQSFNGLAATLGPLAGGIFILSGKNLTAAQEAAMTPGQLNDYLNKEASAVQIPYLIIGLVVLVVAILIFRTPLPEIVEEGSEEVDVETGTLLSKIWALLKVNQLRKGIISQFFYVGAQAGILGFFIRYSERVAGLTETSAKFYLAAATFCFMLGRFSGTYLMKFINPVKLLAFYCSMNVLLLVGIFFLHGMFTIYALMGVTFFMSIMFPTVFSLSTVGLGSRTKLGSSLVIMGIVGGAIIPPIMGKVSDLSSIKFAYLIPIICFSYILYFAYRNLNIKKLEIAAGH
ncbi:L-fucose:H+ symporter permease [Mucilaginibacter sp. BJC16-A38]|uniref:L-fucose:H+ symporter permease n=1 Tax=Mucilaginibacter phenanthrenivorans TaxID=1234842 RepID=UPI00215873A1|nr:L-fucose:H+ symporter permease [Mucilaginibacter phenanthrenivorans]MCR8556343.1 L-fucose:H+ symporter permease [Mucilaginibacter phenanthrenivorans]